MRIYLGPHVYAYQVLSGGARLSHVYSMFPNSSTLIFKS
jgi:hypothetical protein